MDDELFRRAKAEAALRGVRFKKLVADGVRLFLAQPQEKRKRLQFPLVPKKLKGKLSIPDDVAFRAQQRDDRERHEASLRR